MSQIEKTKIELQKEESNGLRGSLYREINNPEASRFSGSAENLLKFHGMYQYKDRDKRAPSAAPPTPKPFTLMVRGRIPGGRLSWQQWLSWDKIADTYAASSLRITTRQSLQLHGVLKESVKATLQEIHKALGSTSGACGDVVRNVTQAVNPWGDVQLEQLDSVADLLSKHFEVSSNAYFEIFLDGEPVLEEKIDPIYGRNYLPRKFKIGLTAAGNNSIDVYTQDLGLVASFDQYKQLAGYFVLVGGGMGMSHSDADTHPRLADLLGWIPASALIPVTEAIVGTQRDYGNRENRSFARLKYLLDKKGVPWFKAEVSRRSGIEFQEKSLPAWQTPHHLGWIEHRDGSLALGFHTLSGRIVDGDRPLKTALRQLISQYKLDVQLTAEQDLILFGIAAKDKRAIETYLDEQGLSPLSPRRLYDRALTCVALPSCMKALAEAERFGPSFFAQLQVLLDRYELNEKAPIVRITGCPNGCARPYAAEIGLVGQAPGHYAIYLGGEPEGQRLAQKVKDKVKAEDLFPLLGRLLELWRAEGEAAELLGDFVLRYGHEKVGDYL
ncbi:MAG: NADPH-dependent assimilatory sulfite reductase hemoprotein subunit [Proteobacteria bacterium]|nr:NADPH-dependent assimilatory sulfite reductase hemoprotein subunit [Pseudomonadota bacterium]